MTDEQLQALLRVKRFEQPPEGYFDGLLRDIHRRQREELLQRPLWKIAIERLQTFFGEHSMSNSAYAGAMASVLVTGALAVTIFVPHGASERGSATVAVATQPPAHISLRVDERPERLLPVGQALGPQTALHTPRYVIDARPVSYDAASLGSF